MTGCPNCLLALYETNDGLECPGCGAHFDQNAEK